MRIGLFIDTTVFGGAEAVVLSLHRGLKALGLDPVLYCFRSPELETMCASLGIEWKEAPAHISYKSAWSLLSFARQFAVRLKEDRIEVLHSHLVGPIIAGHLSATLAGIPHIGTLHDSHTLMERTLWFKVLRILSVSGTKLVAVSEQLRRIVVERSRLNPARIRTIYNGLQPQVMGSGAPEEIRKEFNLKDTDFVIASVGRLVELKRHEQLICAVASLSERHQVRLLIAGEGEERPRLEQVIADLGVSDIVRLIGFRQDISGILAGADAFSLLSRTEGLSCSIMEAMLAEVPCVVTDVGGNRELILTEAEGIVLPNSEIATVAAALESLILDLDLRARMGAQARRRMLSLSDVSRMAASYAAVYQSCFCAKDSSAEPGTDFMARARAAVRALVGLFMGALFELAPQVSKFLV